MASKKGLGRGLDSLIPKKEEPKEIKRTVGGQESYVDINKIEPNKSQPRKFFDEEKLEELADSIRQYGVINPLLVQDRKDYYEIIAGERRWRASKLAGLTEIPVIVKDLGEKEIVELSIIDNIQREDLNPVEEALAYKRLMDEFALTQEEIAKRVSKSRSAVANSVRLLKLDERVRDMLAEGRLYTAHARSIVSIEDPEKQFELADKIINDGMSAREVEKYIKNLGKEKDPNRKKTPVISDAVEAVYGEIEERLKSHLGVKVKIKSKNEESGQIEIEYYSKESLTEIIEKLEM